MPSTDDIDSAPPLVRGGIRPAAGVGL
jgi:hypothetical protein